MRPYILPMLKSLFVLSLIVFFSLPIQAGQLEDGVQAYASWKMDEAMKLLRPLAEKGNPAAQYYVGELTGWYEKPNDLAAAFKWFRLAADQGYAPAEARVGDMYMMTDSGIKQDYSEARKWLEKSALHGYARAQWQLGDIYHFGRGVPKDFKTSMKWFRMAADQGDSGAQGMIGFMYQSGEGVPKNSPEAYFWLSLSERLGALPVGLSSKECAKNLTTEQKSAVDKRIVEWLHRTAEQGQIGSQFALGEMYQTGQVAERNLVQAYKWYSLTVTAGDWYNTVPQRGDGLAAKAIKVISNQMTAEQIKEGKRLAAEWKPAESIPIAKPQ
jgi:TPR repeat protein